MGHLIPCPGWGRLWCLSYFYTPESCLSIFVRAVQFSSKTCGSSEGVLQECDTSCMAVVFWELQLWVISISSILENIVHWRDEEAGSVRKKDVAEGWGSALLSSRWGKLNGALQIWGICTLSMLSIKARIILLYPQSYLSVSGCGK